MFATNKENAPYENVEAILTSWKKHRRLIKNITHDSQTS